MHPKARLKELRIALRISQCQLSKEIGISRSTINRYEDPDHPLQISAQSALKFARFFGVPHTEFFFDAR